jgi:hypothetical protein
MKKPASEYEVGFLIVQKGYANFIRPWSGT